MARVIRSQMGPNGWEFTLDCRCELVVPEHLAARTRPREIDDVVRHCAERHVCPAEEIKRMLDPSPRYGGVSIKPGDMRGVSIKPGDMRAGEWFMSWEPSVKPLQRDTYQQILRAMMVPKEILQPQVPKPAPAIGFTPPAPPAVEAKAPEPEPKKEDRPKDRFDLIELD